MTRKYFYVLVNLIDEVMGISHSDIPDARGRSLVQKRYFSNLGFKFPIGMLKYRRGESKVDCVVIFPVLRGTSTSNSDFIQTIATA